MGNTGQRNSIMFILLSSRHSSFFYPLCIYVIRTTTHFEQNRCLNSHERSASVRRTCCASIHSAVFFDAFKFRFTLCNKSEGQHSPHLLQRILEQVFSEREQRTSGIEKISHVENRKAGAARLEDALRGGAEIVAAPVHSRTRFGRPY